MEDEIETKIGPEKKFFPKNIIILIVIIFLVLTNVVTATYFLIKQKDEQAPNNNANIAVNTQPIINDDNNTPSDETVPTTDEVLPEDKTGGTITVEWNEWPVKVDVWRLFDYGVVDREKALDLVNKLEIYKAGVIKGGVYNSKELFLVVNWPEGPAFQPDLYRVVKNDGEAILLVNHSSEYMEEAMKRIFKENHEIKIANLEPPSEITIPNSNIKLKRSEGESTKFLTSYDSPKKIFLYNGVDYVYKDKTDNCFIVKAGDGTIREYILELPFLDAVGDDNLYSNYNRPYKLNISWISGGSNNNEYMIKRIGTCALGCYNYPDYAKNIDQFVIVGESSEEEVFYEAKDKNLFLAEGDKAGRSIYRAMYDEHYQFFDQAQSKEAKVSYEEFLAGRPIIYWQDPFGDFMEFRDAKFQPMAECGKPVIYLYPEREMDVSVKVTPTGGLSISDPYYGEGWKVKAKPNGEIYNYGDGKIYPYLFWEGFGVNYQTPASGFVVPREKVAQFLESKLPQLGLKENEYKEFMAYWLPKMQEKKYYFISFMPQVEFDKLAPLEIHPKPDTVIRVFMDYFGLDEYQSVRPQIIKTPERKGFTVVEWGGTLGR
ncbi:hypothetical protein GYA54_00285 [Candidatus Kuenenbacteria bacterium]|nr:hypothetical protein [Candidatus Kuenenbacteria bacterium]